MTEDIELREPPYPCHDIKYPFTEEGKPACLSNACPKGRECKVCCKDWSKV